jgi:hypothetical protein
MIAKRARIAVIGAGMAAYAAVSELVKDNHVEVTVFTFDDKEDLSHRVPEYLKKNYGDGSTYDVGKYSVYLPGKGVYKGLCASKRIGGFSNVWGASLDNEDSGYSLSDESVFLREVKVTSTWQKNIFDQESLTSIIFEPARVAISNSLCSNSKKCLSGCPNSAIWNAGLYFHENRKSSKFKIIKNGVKSISAAKEKVSINTFNNEVFEFDGVVIAAGTLGTLALLNRSNSQFSSFTIQDSATEFLIGFKTRNFKSNVKQTLHKSRAIFSNPDSKAQMQIYPDISNLLETALHGKSSIVKILIKFIWPIAKKILTAGILYLDQSDSASLELSFEDGIGKIEVKYNKREVTKKRNIYRIIRNHSLRFGFFPIRFLSENRGVGSGFHFGATTMNYNHGVIDINEGLEKMFQSDKIVVVDSNSLQRISAGPITSEIVRNAKMLTSFLIKRV